MQRIYVTADHNAISSQACTYAEYRLFSALTRYPRKFRRARVLLRPTKDCGAFARVTCAVSVDLDPVGSVRVRVTGPHVYAAINRAIARVGCAVDEHTEQRRSS